MAKSWWLWPESGEAPLALGQGIQVVGSDPDCDLCLTARGVSRHHARLAVEERQVVVEDLDSRNGTFVGDRRVTRAALGDGDRVRFGRVAFVAHLEAEPADETLAIAFTVEAPPVTGPTVELGPVTGVPAWWLEELARLVAVGPRGLEAFRRALGLEGAWLVEWREGGPVVLEGSGPTELLQLRALRLALRVQGREGGLAQGRAGEQTPVAWCVAPTQPRRGVVLAGGFAGAEHGVALATFLLQALRPEDLPPLPRDPDDPALPECFIALPSPAAEAVRSQLQRLAAGEIPVLITGETGTGKELAARLLHHWSERRGSGPLVALNCAALSEDLLESELFGIEAGVATGVGARLGRLRAAEGGVLFLDELGELPLGTQAKLLRVLQEREVVPVGGTAPVPIDLRVVAATNRDLRAEVDAGRFRADLYYRLAGVTVHLPSLRHRTEDIAPLVHLFARRAMAELGRPIRGLSVGALAALERRPWPGNLRELQNEITRLVHLVPDHGVITEHLVGGGAPQPPVLLDDTDEDLTLQDRVEALERRLIRTALARTGGNQSAAARLLGLSRNGLANKLKRLGDLG